MLFAYLMMFNLLFLSRCINLNEKSKNILIIQSASNINRI